MKAKMFSFCFKFTAAYVAIACASFPLNAAAVDGAISWINEVQRPPAQPESFDTGIMNPLLVDVKGNPVRDRDAWARRRREISDAWMSLLGPMPDAPTNNAITIVRDDSLPDCSRLLVRYECEKDLFVDAYILRSKDSRYAGLRPGLVGLHHTATNGIDVIAGLAGPDSRQLGIKLARRGFVVLCPSCFLWKDAKTYQQAVDNFTARHPGVLPMNKMLFDARRAVDILAAQPGVDSRRLGTVGHSLGAKEVLYLTAFDERIKAAVSSEGGLVLKSTNWDAPWYLGTKIKQPGFERNHHELLALIAPRALLVVGGESGRGAADGNRSWLIINAAMPVYRLFDGTPRMGLLNHWQGHTIPPEVFERMAEWLEFYLN